MSRTYNAGGNDERTDWIAKMRRLVKKYPNEIGIKEALEWGLGRAKRVAKKIGGLGKRLATAK
jgi:hypothetical protein